MVEISSIELTEDEAELYDRQIRLWGLDSQKRLVPTRKYAKLLYLTVQFLYFVIIVFIKC
jgi:hypothetical protein